MYANLGNLKTIYVDGLGKCSNAQRYTILQKEALD